MAEWSFEEWCNKVDIDKLWDIQKISAYVDPASSGSERTVITYGQRARAERAQAHRLMNEHLKAQKVHARRLASAPRTPTRPPSGLKLSSPFASPLRG